MPRARSPMSDPRQEYDSLLEQTAAAGQTQGSGCLSGFMLPPLAVLLISASLALVALRVPAPALAQVAPAPPAATAPATSLPAEAGQVTDGSGRLVDPASLPPEVAQVYDGAGQLVSEANIAPEIQAVIVDEASPAPQPVQPVQSVSGLAPFFRPEVLYWGESILRWSAQAGVDPNLAATVMQIESCGDPTAVSRSGAMGLFQVMPFHFRAGENPYDPDTNALRGLNYLSRSFQTAGGSARLALAGYNGGIGVIARGEWTWAAETARYVYFGAPIYEDARNGLSQSSALDEWYTKYGVSLCRRASEHQ